MALPGNARDSAGHKLQSLIMHVNGSPHVMLWQQSKQYIHHNHYTSTLDETTGSERTPVKFQLRLHCRSDSYDVDVYACDVEQKALHVAELYSHLKDRLLEWAVV